MLPFASNAASKPQPTLQLEADASGNWSGQFELFPGVSVINFSAGKVGQSPATPLVVTVRRDSSSSERSAAEQAAKKKAASKLAAANKARAAEQRRKADQAAAAAQQRSACITVPNVVRTNHQGAQDTMQAAGLYSLAEEDATGQGRMLVLDRNWVVVSQNPTGGKCVSADTTITLSSKEIGE